MKRTTIIAAVIAVLVVAGIVYFRVGWSRMVEFCSAEPPPQAVEQDIGITGFEISFTRHGFTCTFDDGSVRSSWLWF